jgi:hypothetical protein
MTISSIGNSHISTQFQAPKNASKSGEAGEVGPDVDGDADDGGRKASLASAAPTVNSSGQTVGQLINVKA